jgi:hypothetical protein
MFDLPTFVVKGGNWILDFLDHNLIKFTNNRVCVSVVNAAQLLEESPENEKSHDEFIVNNLSS